MQRENHMGTRSVLVLREHDSVWAPEAKAGVLAAAEAIHSGLAHAGYDVIPVQIESPQALLSALQPFNPARYVVFNWYEGLEPCAEDAAQVTALLDELGFIYTGADTIALRTTQDKIRGGRVLHTHGIPTPAGQPAAADNLSQWNRYPAIVKLATEHGSECMTVNSVVHDEEALRAQVDKLTAAGIQSLMVSEFVDGREFTVSLWGNGTLEALPLLEVDYGAYPPSVPHIRSFEAKWDAASAAHQSIRLGPPRDLPSQLQDRIERTARDAYRAFGLRDYGRIDLRLKQDAPQVIDVNSNPDITADSSFVAAAERAGYDYPTMLDRIVRFAIHRDGGNTCRT
jgi:D-alanine-D-alanine ligase